MNYIYITFNSVNDALAFEFFFTNKLNFRLVPVPRKISKSCGIAIRLLEEDYKQNSEKINKSNIVFKKIYRL